jgi:hypothetical protein
MNRSAHNEIEVGTLGTIRAVLPTTYSVLWDGLDYGLGVYHERIEAL